MSHRDEVRMNERTRILLLKIRRLLHQSVYDKFFDEDAESMIKEIESHLKEVKDSEAAPVAVEVPERLWVAMEGLLAMVRLHHPREYAEAFLDIDALRSGEAEGRRG